MNIQAFPYLIGVDIVETVRIERAIRRHGQRLLNRVFSQGEIDYCQGKRMSSLNYAARFAAKEAVVKAASEICKLHYKQIEVIRAESGAPSIKIHDSDVLSGDEIRISFSHSNEYAVAMVLLNMPKK
jgi:holo-[acyl-carrier protein] synthase